MHKAIRSREYPQRSADLTSLFGLIDSKKLVQENPGNISRSIGRIKGSYTLSLHYRFVSLQDQIQGGGYGCYSDSFNTHASSIRLELSSRIITSRINSQGEGDNRWRRDRLAEITQDPNTRHHISGRLMGSHGVLARFNKAGLLETIILQRRNRLGDYKMAGPTVKQIASLARAGWRASSFVNMEGRHTPSGNDYLTINFDPANFPWERNMPELISRLLPEVNHLPETPPETELPVLAPVPVPVFPRLAGDETEFKEEDIPF